MWITFNEPHLMSRFGYSKKSPIFFPPGGQTNLDCYIVAQTIVKTHATVYRSYESDFYASQKGYFMPVTLYQNSDEVK